jgi:hypothetical protein
MFTEGIAAGANEASTRLALVDFLVLVVVVEESEFS